ncbi:MAG TPA: hypothetical protein VMS71_05035, partial [Candidatus Acidoferrum sp.]|nr:hypothetical protein [Candidatus Acidoferrum sp.]
MNTRAILRSLLAVVFLTGLCSASDSRFFKEFKKNYAILDQDLLNNPGEVADIKDFTYTKDIATFTFISGRMALLRYVNGRPTTAIFVGQGHVSIQVPSHLERQALFTASKDSSVEQDFQTCFIRMA